MNIASQIATLGQNIASKSAKNVAVASIVFMSVFSMNVAQASSLGPDTIADMVEENLDAVVNISVTQYIDSTSRSQSPILQPGSPFEELFKDFFNEKGLKKFQEENEKKNRKGKKKSQRKVGSLGSGFVISDDGYVVTNEHVINSADEITVILNNGEEYKAKVVGADKKTDIALLKIEGDDDFKFVEFGDDKELRVGSWVVTIGNPFGFGSSVSAGIVSANHRNLRSGPYDDFIQTDASINKGNSGGPLFNLDGKVVGVNAAIVSPTGGSVGIGFSIPASTVVPVIAQLKEYGETRRGWLGVSIRDISDDIAESIGMDKARGAFVVKVFKDSPAQKAGVERQDVIVKFNGKNIKDSAALPRIVASTEINKQVEIIVLRDGEEVALDVTVSLLKEGEKKAIAEISDNTEDEAVTQTVLGLELLELNKTLNKRYKLDPKTKGLMIVSVEDDSVAAEKRLRPGDRIVAAALKDVETFEELNKLIDKTKDKGRKRILLLIEQPDGNSRSVALPLD